MARPAARRRRRTARVRGSLSREEIVEAGLRLARAGDLRTLTMQRLGDELGVTGMAIYRHFDDKQAVIDGILDHFVREAGVTGHGTDPSDWRLWLRRTLRAMYGALADTPGVLPFVATGTAWRFGAGARLTHEEVLRVLGEAGFSDAEAEEIHATGIALVVGFASLGSETGELLERGLGHYLDGLG